MTCMVGNTCCDNSTRCEVEESLGNLRRGQKVDGDCHEANYVSHLHKSPRTELRAERQCQITGGGGFSLPDKRTHKVLADFIS